MNAPTGLDRRAVVRRLLEDRRDLVAISGLGSPTYDLAAAGDHPRNFYLWGAMGGAAMVGLGLALARPDTPVAVFTGDGEMMMGAGSLAAIAQQAPANLRIVVLDNGLYGETGGQKSHTAGVARLDLIGAGCGLAATVIDNEAEVEALAARLTDVRAGAELAVIRIAPGEAGRVLPSRDGVLLKGRLRAAVGVETTRWT